MVVLLPVVNYLHKAIKQIRRQTIPFGQVGKWSSLLNKFKIWLAKLQKGIIMLAKMLIYEQNFTISQ